MGQYQTGIITSVDQVPDGYVQLVTFSDRKQPGGKTIHKALSDGHQRGDIRAVKLMRSLSDVKTGPVYIHRGDAEKFLRDRAASGRTGKDSNGRIVPGGKARFEAEDAEAFATPEQAAAAADDLYGAISDLRGIIERLRDSVDNLTTAMELRAECEMVCKEANADGTAANQG